MEDLVLSCLESRVEENRNLYARFLIGPFVKGQALTVATALRRSLLSSVESIGITALSIQGITHEFSTIAGVRESVLELSLNFQKVVLCYQKDVSAPKKIYEGVHVGYLQVQGPKIVYANDLKLPLGIGCVDPTQYIATLSTKGLLVVKFLIGKSNSTVDLTQYNRHKSTHDALQSFVYKKGTHQVTKRTRPKARAVSCAPFASHVQQTTEPSKLRSCLFAYSVVEATSPLPLRSRPCLCLGQLPIGRHAFAEKSMAWGECTQSPDLVQKQNRALLTHKQQLQQKVQTKQSSANTCPHHQYGVVCLPRTRQSKCLIRTTKRSFVSHHQHKTLKHYIKYARTLTRDASHTSVACDILYHKLPKYDEKSSVLKKNVAFDIFKAQNIVKAKKILYPRFASTTARFFSKALSFFKKQDVSFTEINTNKRPYFVAAPPTKQSLVRSARVHKGAWNGQKPQHVQNAVLQVSLPCTKKAEFFKSDLSFRHIIPLDFPLTPINQVNFTIETDNEVVHLYDQVRERIILEVWTNGSVQPRQAVHEAVLSLIESFSALRATMNLNKLIKL